MSQQLNQRIGVWYSNDETNQYKCGKPVTVFGQECWVNVYPQDPDKKAENPNLPDLNIVLSPVRPRA